MDIIGFFWGVIAGIFIIGGVYALIHMAWNAIFDAYNDIHN